MASVSGSFGIVVLIFGVLAGASATSADTQRDPFADPKQHRVLNDELHQRIRALNEALAGDPCAMPAVETLLAQLPSSIQSKDISATSKRLSRGELVERLHHAVVMVLAGNQTGSGFFIAPDTVVTNHHVVDGASEAVMVIGRGTGGPQKVSVQAMVGDGRRNSRDYAVLRLEKPIDGVRLALSRKIEDLAQVVAAGYPDVLLDNDMKYGALVAGDASAIPELAFSQGAVMVVQNRGRGIGAIAHSAPISAGNSGGPLVDACGRVVGINTFINVAVDQARSAGFALASEDLTSYLTEAGARFELDDRACADFTGTDREGR